MLCLRLFFLLSSAFLLFRASTTEQLDIYQGKALEYSQQNKQLRRDIANERFSRSRSDEKGYFPSL